MLPGAVLAAGLLASMGEPGRPIGWAPNPGPQVRFLSCPADEVLYGGAAGGGKSDALLVALLRQVHLEGYVGLYLRREYPAMQEAMERAAELYPLAGGRWHKSERTWRFPSGSRVLFRHLQHEDTVQQFKSQAFAVIAWDELTTFTEAQFTYLRSRNRSTAPGVRCQIIAATNPDGPGLGWVRQRFIDGATPNTIRVEKMSNGVERTRAFIPATLADNPHLGEDYEAALLSLGEADRKALLGGDWYAYDGQVFRLERGRNLLDLEEAQRRWGGQAPPAWWPRFRVMDWGYARPYAVLWAAIDPEGRAWVYRELYGAQRDATGATKANVGAGHSASHVASLIRSVEHEAGEANVTSWAGPDLWAAGRGDYGASRPLVDEFREAGCQWTAPWAAASGTRRTKRQRLCSLLETGEVGGNLAGLVIVRDRCPDLVRTLPSLQYSRLDPEDVDTTAEDHAYDALAGLVMMRTWGGVLEGPGKGLQERLASGEWNPGHATHTPWEAR